MRDERRVLPILGQDVSDSDVLSGPARKRKCKRSTRDGCPLHAVKAGAQPPKRGGSCARHSSEVAAGCRRAVESSWATTL